MKSPANCARLDSPAAASRLDLDQPNIAASYSGLDVVDRRLGCTSRPRAPRHRGYTEAGSPRRRTSCGCCREFIRPSVAAALPSCALNPFAPRSSQRSIHRIPPLGAGPLAPDLHRRGGSRRGLSATIPPPARVWRMITKQDLERLINREETGRPVVSLFLDMSVNQNNKRTHQVFLSQKRAEFEEIQAEWMAEHVEGMQSLTDRIQGWLASDYAEANAGVVIYAEVGGDWFEALQSRAPLQNRLTVAPAPA